jgi:beta-xylosidase
MTLNLEDTLLDRLENNGNFIISSFNQSDHWSKLYLLNNSPGIDPSNRFEDGGSA